MNIKIDYTLEFKRNIRQLIKKYPSIRQDIVTIYSKSEQSDIAVNELKRIIKQFNASNH